MGAMSGGAGTLYVNGVVVGTFTDLCVQINHNELVRASGGRPWTGGTEDGSVVTSSSDTCVLTTRATVTYIAPTLRHKTGKRVAEWKQRKVGRR